MPGSTHGAWGHPPPQGASSTPGQRCHPGCPQCLPRWVWGSNLHAGSAVQEGTGGTVAPVGAVLLGTLHPPRQVGTAEGAPPGARTPAEQPPQRAPSICPSPVPCSAPSGCGAGQGAAWGQRCGTLTTADVAVAALTLQAQPWARCPLALSPAQPLTPTTGHAAGTPWCPWCPLTPRLPSAPGCQCALRHLCGMATRGSDGAVPVPAPALAPMALGSPSPTACLHFTPCSAWHCPAPHGTKLCHTALPDTSWHSMALPCHMELSFMAWHPMALHGTAQHHMTQHCSTPCPNAHHGTTGPHMALDGTM